MDDLPRRGEFVLARIAAEHTPDATDARPRGAQLSELLRRGGITKQLGTQLMDTLVTRGYVTRQPDPEDRRRMTVALTERGEAAASAITEAIARVDTELTAKVGAEQIETARTVLSALTELAPEAGRGPGRGFGGGRDRGMRRLGGGRPPREGEAPEGEQRPHHRGFGARHHGAHRRDVRGRGHRPHDGA